MAPFVSIIIPARNEEEYIGRCLDSILEQDYPKENLEILVIDGMSEDKTREIVKKFSAKGGSALGGKIKLIDNPNKFISFAMNIGIKNSQGEIIVKMDGHTVYEKDYISKCVEYLEKSGADNVGGVLRTVPAKNTVWARAIALALSHRFGVGNSYFRAGSEKPRWVDTVSFGCYKKEIFARIGLYNEKLARSEDFEFNLRLRKAGGKILLAPDIAAYYYPQSDFIGFLSHNFSDGFWVTYPLKFGLKIFSWRHLIPLIFILTLPLNIWPYILLSLFFSAKIALKEDLRFVFVLPFVFFNRHFAYGFGSLWGLIRIIF